MTNAKYGTTDYFYECFSDMFADVVDTENPELTKNMIEGLYTALDRWFDYHDAQARAYAELRKRIRQTLTV